MFGSYLDAVVSIVSPPDRLIRGQFEISLGQGTALQFNHDVSYLELASKLAKALKVEQGKAVHLNKNK